VRSRDESVDAQGRTRRRPRRRSDGGIEAVATLQGWGSAEGMVGEHLNEATITRLGSILECGNVTGHRNCRSTVFSLPRAELRNHIALREQHSGEGRHIGPGKIGLFEAIKTEGSITAAAAQLKTRW
jgi:hypothetical protein